MSLQVSFSGGYHHYLKTYFDKGLLPTVKKGLYGDPININNRSLEHMIPRSKKGPTELWNLALASVRKNNKRGCRPLQEVLTQEQLEDYALQFKDVKVRKLCGNAYIAKLRELGRKLGIIKGPSRLDSIEDPQLKLDLFV